MAEKVSIKPDYRKIYHDIIQEQFSNKENDFKRILQKEAFTNYDVIKLNRKLFGKSEVECGSENQKLKSYSKDTIIEVLKYQTENKYSNSAIANQFNISRNTIARWRKFFLPIVAQQE